MGQKWQSDTPQELVSSCSLFLLKLEHRGCSTVTLTPPTRTESLAIKCSTKTVILYKNLYARARNTFANS